MRPVHAANDRQPIREGDETADPLTDRWRALYRTRVEALAKVFTDRKIPLIWVGLPPVQSESLSRDLASLNDIVRDTVTKAGGTYVDIWPGFVDDRDRYAASGPDPEGQIAKLRTADGVHFTKAGDRKLAHFAELYGTTVELNGPGGLGGHVHVQLGCAIANTQYYEHFERFAPLARECGITNPPTPVDGCLTPSMAPGWGAEIDWDYVRTHTVHQY